MVTNKDDKDTTTKETRKEYIELGTRDPDVIFKDKGKGSNTAPYHSTNCSTNYGTNKFFWRTLRFLKILCNTWKFFSMSW